jgi:hypothetical protein
VSKTELESSVNPQKECLRYAAHAFERAGSGDFPVARKTGRNRHWLVNGDENLLE